MILSKLRSNLDEFFSNLNTHPIPLEFSQSLTTGERLSTMYKLIMEYLEKYEQFGDDVTQQIDIALNNKYKEISELINTQINGTITNSDLLTKLKKLLEQSIDDAFKYVTFGLDDGYFVAYIPNTWSISFDTDVLTSSPNYGKLIITY